jgi:hypothetical protein
MRARALGLTVDLLSGGRVEESTNDAQPELKQLTAAR